MKHLFVASLFLLLSAEAWSCGCSNIASMDDAVAFYPTLVEAEVVSREEVNSEFGRAVRSVTLRVKNVLKGEAAETIVVNRGMCYSSLYTDLMKPQHIYVLPLAAPVKGRYEMAHCSHSGMELIDGKLYTFEEQANGKDRQLKFYKPYSALQNMFPSKVPIQ